MCTGQRCMVTWHPSSLSHYSLCQYTLTLSATLTATPTSTPTHTIPTPRIPPSGTRVSEDQPDRPVHLLCVSPDAPTNPVLYFLGPYIDGRFLLEEATGPHRLDLGDTLYAPNTFVDAKGRQVLWGWLQEKRDGTGEGGSGWGVGWGMG